MSGTLLEGNRYVVDKVSVTIRVEFLILISYVIKSQIKSKYIDIIPID